MTVRIVVADEREASFFDIEGINAPLRLISKIEDPTARLHDRDLETDRPGRAFDRMAPGRHAMDGERSTQRQHQIRFVARIAEEIEQGRNRQAFDRLVVIAGPRMLGLIREALSKTSRSAIAAEVSKDLVHLDVEAIRGYLPREVFSSAAFTAGS